MVGKTCNLPTSCPCSSKFDIQHSVSYKKGGFICIRYNDLRDQTADMSEVCKDTEIEPKLTQRVDIRTRGFWERCQQAFFRLWVFDPNTCRYRNKSLQQCYVMNEHEKKRVCNEGILQIDHGKFTPLVFSINGGMGRECQKFYLRLAQMNLKRETFRNRFQVIRFEQKFALGC